MHISRRMPEAWERYDLIMASHFTLYPVTKRFSFSNSTLKHTRNLFFSSILFRISDRKYFPYKRSLHAYLKPKRETTKVHLFFYHQHYRKKQKKKKNSKNKTGAGAIQLELVRCEFPNSVYQLIQQLKKSEKWGKDVIF